MNITMRFYAIKHSKLMEQKIEKIEKWGNLALGH